MALPAADPGFFDILLGFSAVGTDLDLLGQEWKWPFELWSELHMLTGIRSQDTRYRAAVA